VPTYETGDFAPPAPVARAVVRGPAGRTRSGVPLLLDTGADVSVVPRSAAAEVAAEVQPSAVTIRFYDGSETVCDLAELSVEFLRYRFRGTFVVGDADYGVLGRNILNSLVLTLDGPGQVWTA
jgi:hypothetical protein